jgi:glycosyltransferase involved in cell wall biosynthesis
MKTINFLSYYFIPENISATNRVQAMVNQLEKKYKVNVICTTEKGKPQRVGKVKYTDNIDIYYVDQKMYDGEKFYTRAIHELYYASRIVLKSLRVPSDITIITSPSMFLIPISALLVRGKKIIDIRDLVWEYIKGTSLYSKILKSQITLLMKQSLKAFNSISVTNDYEVNWIKENIKNADPLKITNGIENSKFLELLSMEPKKLDKFTITYIGNVGIAQHIETLVDAAKELKDIQVNIVGDGSRYVQLKSYVKKNNIKNVEFFGKVPRAKMIDFYSTSSLLFAQLDDKFQAAMPSKLYEYTSTGLPIIYAGKGIAREFVNKLENCITIDPMDSKALVGAISSYLDKDLVISQKNRDFIKENFIRETQSLKLVDLVDTLLENK